MGKNKINLQCPNFQHNSFSTTKRNNLYGSQKTQTTQNGRYYQRLFEKAPVEFFPSQACSFSNQKTSLLTKMQGCFLIYLAISAEGISVANRMTRPRIPNKNQIESSKELQRRAKLKAQKILKITSDANDRDIKKAYNRCMKKAQQDNPCTIKQGAVSCGNSNDYIRCKISYNVLHPKRPNLQVDVVVQNDAKNVSVNHSKMNDPLSSELNQRNNSQTSDKIDSSAQRIFRENPSLADDPIIPVSRINSFDLRSSISFMIRIAHKIHQGVQVTTPIISASVLGPFALLMFASPVKGEENLVNNLDVPKRSFSWSDWGKDIQMRTSCTPSGQFDVCDLNEKAAFEGTLNGVAEYFEPKLLELAEYEHHNPKMFYAKAKALQTSIHATVCGVGALHAPGGAHKLTFGAACLGTAALNGLVGDGFSLIARKVAHQPIEATIDTVINVIAPLMKHYDPTVTEKNSRINALLLVFAAGSALEMKHSRHVLHSILHIQSLKPTYYSSSLLRNTNFYTRPFKNTQITPNGIARGILKKTHDALPSATFEHVMEESIIDQIAKANALSGNDIHFDQLSGMNAEGLEDLVPAGVFVPMSDMKQGYALDQTERGSSGSLYQKALDFGLKSLGWRSLQDRVTPSEGNVLEQLEHVKLEGVGSLDRRYVLDLTEGGGFVPLYQADFDFGLKSLGWRSLQDRVTPRGDNVLEQLEYVKLEDVGSLDRRYVLDPTEGGGFVPLYPADLDLGLKSLGWRSLQDRVSPLEGNVLEQLEHVKLEDIGGGDLGYVLDPTVGGGFVPLYPADLDLGLNSLGWRSLQDRVSSLEGIAFSPIELQNFEPLDFRLPNNALGLMENMNFPAYENLWQGTIINRIQDMNFADVGEMRPGNLFIQYRVGNGG